jgi:hypothetical protein
MFYVGFKYIHASAPLRWKWKERHMAHKLVSIKTTALVLALGLTLPAATAAAGLRSQGATVGHSSSSWLPQLPWIGALLAHVLSGDSLSRGRAGQGSAVDPNGMERTQATCQSVPLFPINSMPNQGSACDPNG